MPIILLEGSESGHTSPPGQTRPSSPRAGPEPVAQQQPEQQQQDEHLEEKAGETGVPGLPQGLTPKPWPQSVPKHPIPNQGTHTHTLPSWMLLWIWPACSSDPHLGPASIPTSGDCEPLHQSLYPGRHTQQASWTHRQYSQAGMAQGRWHTGLAGGHLPVGQKKAGSAWDTWNAAGSEAKAVYTAAPPSTSLSLLPFPTQLPNALVPSSSCTNC